MLSSCSATTIAKDVQYVRYRIWYSDDRASWYILIKNQRAALISQIYFWNKTLHVSDSPSVHHQEFFTVHTAMVYVIEVCWQLANRIRTEPVPSWYCSLAVSKPVWHTPLLCVQWKTPDDGQRDCPKRVEFYSKNKFEKLVHLFGFIDNNNKREAIKKLTVAEFSLWSIVILQRNPREYWHIWPSCDEDKNYFCFTNWGVRK